MAENTVQTQKAPKKSWFKGLKSEFSKIIWPDKESVAKQSVAVVVVTIIMAVLITAIDAIFKYGISFIL